MNELRPYLGVDIFKNLRYWFWRSLSWYWYWARLHGLRCAHRDEFECHNNRRLDSEHRCLWHLFVITGVTSTE